MYQPIQPTITSPSDRTSLRQSPLRRDFGLLCLVLTLTSLALSPAARAVTPPPDGGYPGQNTAEGKDALFHLTSGRYNTAIGFQTLYNNATGSDNTATGRMALFSNTTGYFNTANGVNALYYNTTGFENTASGFEALFSNTTGYWNTANGSFALFANTTGTFNTANGSFALAYNTTGGHNTATGFSALAYNVGYNNTANGVYALSNDNAGNNNTANGGFALRNNSTGSDNTAIGFQTLYNNGTGRANTANGVNALISNWNGSNNTANGVYALKSNGSGNNNTANGIQALESNTSGSNNIALGANAGANLTTGSNNIDIGNRGLAGESDRIRIGKVGTQTATFIAGIYGATVANGVQVVAGPNGRLGTVVSSKRFKDQITPMEKESEAILALKPVSFRYKEEIDPESVPQFGLVAEEVEKINPDLVVRDEKGEVYSVRYEAVNAMLLNEFLKAHRKDETRERKVEEQEETIARLKSTAADQQKEIKALRENLKEQASLIQEVTRLRRVELRKPHRKGS